MKIGIIGYGKMGKAVEKIAVQRGHSIAFKTNDFNLNLINDVDVTIEFSTPESAFTNIKKCLDSNVPVVTGTTGWLDDLEDIKNLCDKKNGSFLYASNFSLGANLFFELNKKLSYLMAGKNEYKTSIDEIHHVHKVDKPSGTAITLAKDIISDSRYRDWELDSHSKDKISISSIRENEVNGVHKVSYSSENDIISIKHEALNRNGFALGAVISAEWLVNKKGCFSISDMLIMG